MTILSDKQIINFRFNDLRSLFTIDKTFKEQNNNVPYLEFCEEVFFFNSSFDELGKSMSECWKR